MKEVDILAQLKRKYDAEMVSALIGAGFTKNVYPKAMSWDELLKGIVEQAYDRELQEMYQQYAHRRFGVDVQSFEECKDDFIETIIKRDGYLDIVSKYISYKGYREAIDYYIETHTPYFYKISDEKYGVKGDDETVLTAKDFTVHQRFLLGNWQYVFTTNYDNALEFTSEQFDLEYLTIKSDYEMSRKKMARPIVKIHGSLIPPEESLNVPFVFDGDYSGRYIISKEDFENYFKKHEAFSYLLRVAMLSGSYCLLGFSGDDPNFKTWLNWVKDILDKNSHKEQVIEDTKEKGIELVKKDEEDIKVFLILTDNNPLPEDQKLYYRNHHIGVIHLDDPEIRACLRYSDNANKSFKIDRFLKYIVGTNDETTSDLQEHTEQKPTAVKGWREVYNKLNGKEPADDAIRNLLDTLHEERYVKNANIQDYVIDELLDKKGELTEPEKQLLLIAMKDVGVPTICFREDVKKQMETLSEWKAEIIHEETLEASEESLNNDNDFNIQENVLRLLYRLDFSAAKKMLAAWEPREKYVAKKASLNYFFNKQDSLKLLDSIIMNSESEVEKYTASFIYNCLESGFIATYPLYVYRNKGIVGLNDVLLSTLDELKENEIELDTYGTEVVHLRADKSNPDAPAIQKSYRFLNLVSSEGFNLCYGISNIINVRNWYAVFKRLYTSFPFACLFYSCQYNNKKVLRRIGQDFAFEEKLQEELPDMLHAVFGALKCKETPGTMLSGMLQVGSQFFWGLKEDVWYDDFKDYLCSVFVEEEDKYLHSGDAKSFVRNALVCLHDKQHISEVLTVLLKLYDKMQDDVIGMLLHQVRLNKIEKLDEEQTELVEMISVRNKLKNDVVLLSVLDEHILLPQDIKESYVKAQIEKIDDLRSSDRFSLFNLCCLAEGMTDIVVKLKEVILERNIWDSGVGQNWIVEAKPFYFLHLGKSFVWSIEEIIQISENLKFNLSKLTKQRITETLFDRQYKSLLMEMKNFVELYGYAVDEEIKKDIEDKLTLVLKYDSLENGLYSDNPDAVETATSELNKQYRKGAFEENMNLFNILLSKCTMQKGPGLSECLITISIAIHFCGESIKQDEKLIKDLYRLLLQYKGKDLRDLDLQVIHAGHALLEIAGLLYSTEWQDENVEYWIKNENLNRLNYLEF